VTGKLLQRQQRSSSIEAELKEDEAQRAYMNNPKEKRN
jgi:hypothetical protein